MKNTERFLWGTGIAAVCVAATAATSYMVTKDLVRIAVDRECPHKITPKARNRFTGGAVNARFLQSLSDAAAKLRATPHETVEITARDGQHLVGHWFPHPEAKRVILTMHGWRSGWASDFGLIHDFFVENECSILYAEQRGQGRSGGDHMGLGLLERYDCLEWLRWLGADMPIFLAGISMGATTVLMATGFDLPKNVRGVIADCGFTSAYDISRHILRQNLHLSFRSRTRAANAMFRKRLRMEIQEYSTVDALAEATVPVLFIHGTDDSFVPVSMTYENYKSCRTSKELLIVPGAEHGMSYYQDKARYQAAVRQFWQAHG
ncbi:MAG: alpha/beta hydrolase [Oscillospiraceae bacterium]|nr:alpha/beta hydrolase [Oscillospiraceae bacterium]